MCFFTQKWDCIWYAMICIDMHVCLTSGHCEAPLLYLTYLDKCLSWRSLSYVCPTRLLNDSHTTLLQSRLGIWRHLWSSCTDSSDRRCFPHLLRVKGLPLQSCNSKDQNQVLHVVMKTTNLLELQSQNSSVKFQILWSRASKTILVD